MSLVSFTQYISEKYDYREVFSWTEPILSDGQMTECIPFWQELPSVEFWRKKAVENH